MVYLSPVRRAGKIDPPVYTAHLFADSVEELVRFAAGLGLPMHRLFFRAWRLPVYVLVGRRVEAARQRGAKEADQATYDAYVLRAEKGEWNVLMQ